MATRHYEEEQKRLLWLLDEIEIDPKVEMNDDDASLGKDLVETVDSDIESE